MLAKFKMDRRELMELADALGQDKTVQLAASIYVKKLGAVSPTFTQLTQEKFGFTPEELESAQ